MQESERRSSVTNYSSCLFCNSSLDALEQDVELAARGSYAALFDVSCGQTEFSNCT
jgi:hypothetical protein